MRLPYGETITVKRLGQDHHGEPTVLSQHDVGGCLVAQRASTEPLDYRTSTVTTATLLAPYGADLQDTDRVVQADGTQWDVVGRPSNIKSPLTGWKPGQRATLQHVSG